MDEVENIEFYELTGKYGLNVQVHAGGAKATKELLDMCKISKDDYILVVGCGSGMTALQIAETYESHVIGIDIAENMIELAKKKARKKKINIEVEFRIADVFSLPFDDATFDLVLFESVLNILRENKSKAMKEIIRVTKPGGRVGANELAVDPSTPQDIRDLGKLTLVTTDLPELAEWEQFFAKDLTVIETIDHPAWYGMSGWGALRDVIGQMGILRFVFGYPRMLLRVMLDSRMRRMAMDLDRGKAAMFRNKKTRDFFRYILIVAEKTE